MAVQLLHMGLQGLEGARAVQSLEGASGLMQRDVSLDLLEGVAKLRYGLLVVANLLQQRVNSLGGASSTSHAQVIFGSAANQLLEEARRVCSVRSVNTFDTSGHGNTTGPAVYLMKLIVRQGGFGELKKVAETDQWVVPESLRQEEVRREGGRD